MNYTLDICGDKTINNPSATDIQSAVYALNTKKGDAFLILSQDEMSYIQTSGDQKIGFDLEYQEGDAQHHYRAKGDPLIAEQIIGALTSYLSGTAEWKNVAEWELMEW